MKLSEILNDILPDWGICSFDCVRDKLISCRALSRLPDSPESVIMAVFPYLLNDSEYKERNISRYSVVHDYHDIVPVRLNEAKRRLQEVYPSGSFEVFSDNSPIPEVYAACRAGIGVKGVNGILINKTYGSFVFIGEIVTDIELDAVDSPVNTCIGCCKCIEACPAKAISPDGFRAADCLSGISQKKSDLSVYETAMIKAAGCAWGCDICQDVCPMNHGIHADAISEFLTDPISHISIDTPIEGRAFSWRGPNVIRRNLEIIGEK